MVSESSKSLHYSQRWKTCTHKTTANNTGLYDGALSHTGWEGKRVFRIESKVLFGSKVRQLCTRVISDSGSHLLLPIRTTWGVFKSQCPACTQYQQEEDAVTLPEALWTPLFWVFMEVLLPKKIGQIIAVGDWTPITFSPFFSLCVLWAGLNAPVLSNHIVPSVTSPHPEAVGMGTH